MRALLRLSIFIFFLFIVSSCRPSSPASLEVDALAAVEEPAGSDVVSARRVLIEFFRAIEAEDYSTAAALHAGNNLENVRQTLADWHPGWNADPDDTAAILEKACAGGYTCLALRRLLEEKVLSQGTYEFRVELKTNEGQLFELGPCCGADETEIVPQTVFSYVVRTDLDGQLRVVWEPIYVP